MATLTIAELVSRAADFQSEDRTPFARTPWGPNSVVLWRDGDSTDPIVQDGQVFEYFLEPHVIERVLDFATDETSEEVVARVIQYAINDA